MSDAKMATPSRISDNERAILRAMFKDNEPALKLMRKIFLPELSVEAPIGHQISMWTLMADVAGMVPDQAMPIIIARKHLVTHLELCLQSIQALANSEPETPEKAAERQNKDSSR